MLTVQFNYVRKIDGNGNKTLEPGAAVRGVYTDGDRHRSGPRQRARAPRTIARCSSTRCRAPTRRSGRTSSASCRPNGNNRYHAFGVTLNKQFSNKYSFLVVVRHRLPRPARQRAAQSERGALRSAERQYLEREHGHEPATSSHRPSWNYAFRLSGTYQLPWGITYASSFTAQSGDYFFREVQVRDALNTHGRHSHRAAGRSLRLDEDLGQPHLEAHQDVRQPVDRRDVRPVQHAERQHDHGADQPQRRDLSAADRDHRAARLPPRRSVQVLDRAGRVSLGRVGRVGQVGRVGLDFADLFGETLRSTHTTYLTRSN